MAPDPSGSPSRQARDRPPERRREERLGEVVRHPAEAALAFTGVRRRSERDDGQMGVCGPKCPDGGRGLVAVR